MKERIQEQNTRLQIDPGGGDKIDELESAIGWYKNDSDSLKSALKMCADDLKMIGNQLECPSRNTTMTSYRRDGSVIISHDIRDKIKETLSDPLVKQALESINPNKH